MVAYLFFASPPINSGYITDRYNTGAKAKNVLR